MVHVRLNGSDVDAELTIRRKDVELARPRKTGNSVRDEFTLNLLITAKPMASRMLQSRRTWFLWLCACATVSACSSDPSDFGGTGGGVASGGSMTIGGSADAGGSRAAAYAGSSTAGGALGSAGSAATAAGSAASSGGAASGGLDSSGGQESDSAAAGGTGGVGRTGTGTGTGTGGMGAQGGSANQANLPATTLHLAGDSTVMDYAPPSAQEGWGQELEQYFISKVTVDNKALGGTSVQTFHTDGRWAEIIDALKAGDFVMADFGINDSGGTPGRAVTTADFQTLMSQMSEEVKAKQATFIIVTPSALQYWSGGMETNARLAPYVAVENMLGSTSKIPIDDLNARSLEFLNEIGQTAAMQIYINGDKAHFTKMGATQMAKFVASELQRIGSPLGAYLK